MDGLKFPFELGVPFDPADTVVEAGSSITAIVEYIVVPNDIVCIMVQVQTYSV